MKMPKPITSNNTLLGIGDANALISDKKTLDIPYDHPYVAKKSDASEGANHAWAVYNR